MKRIRYNAPVVLTFALLSLLALFLGIVTEGRSTRLLFCVYRSSWRDPLAYVRVFTHVLGHANFEHYSSNMMILLLVGPMLEEKYGSVNLLEMIAITSLVTGIVNLLLFPSALLGASGIVFMMIILSSMTGEKGTIPLTLIVAAVMYLGTEIWAGISRYDNISQLTHIVGGVLGCIFGMMVRGDSKPAPRRRQ